MTTMPPVYDTDWADQAECRTVPPQLVDRWFFPGQGGSHVEAFAICRRCPVRAECLDFALSTHQAHGVWGGTSERRRRQMQHERRRQHQPA